jgi:hypothetical protein
VKNIVLGNVKISAKQYKVLCKYKKVLRKIAEAKGIKAKRKHIVQKGGGAFIPALLAAAIPTIIELLKS